MANKKLPQRYQDAVDILALLDRIITGEQIHPFDWVNQPHYMDPKPEDGTEYTERLFSQAKLGCFASATAAGSAPTLFIPCAMSNGWLAYALAEDNKDKILQATKARYDEAFLTTQGLRHYVAGSELLNRVIQPNGLANHAFMDRLERIFPGHAMSGPVDLEGPLREQRSNPGLSQGASYQDWTFEVNYLPEVMACSGMVLGLDHAWSRYANIEELIGDVIQCGLLDHLRSQKGQHFDIMDETRRHVTLTDRAWERAKHIVHAVERGFRTDLAVATLMAQFQIDDWLRGPDHGPIDLKKVHPVLKNRGAAELARMDDLKQLMLPYIAAKCLPWVNVEDDSNLKTYVEAKVIGQEAGFRNGDAARTRQKLFLYQPAGGFAYPDAMRAVPVLSQRFSSATRMVKRRGTNIAPFHTKAELFEDNHFSKLPLWEQSALPFIIGYMERRRPPENRPRTLFFACNPKGGQNARDWADARGISWIREAQSAEDPIGNDYGFHKVILANIDEATQAQAEMEQDKAVRANGFGNVISTLEFLNIKTAVRKFRPAIAAEGSDVLSSRGVLAAMMDYMDRAAEGLVLRKGWENHHDDVQIMLRGVLHAVGLVDRPYDGGRYRMDIHERDMKTGVMKRQDLHDLISTLGARVESYLDNNAAWLETNGDQQHWATMASAPDQDAPAPARAEFTALARLLQISDMLADPGRMNVEFTENRKTGAKSRHDIIEWHNVDQGLIWFRHQDPSKRADLLATPAEERHRGQLSMRDRLREKLLTTGVLFMAEEDLKGLDEDYAAAWRKAHTLDEHEQRRVMGGRTSYLGWRQPV